MECYVCGSRCAATAELIKCGGPYLIIEDEPCDILQVAALLGGRAVHDGLQLHSHEGARLSDERTDLDVRSTQGCYFDGGLGGAVAGPGMGEGMQSVTRIIARLVDLDLSDLEEALTLPYTVGSSTEDGSTGSAPRAARST
jgi:hypothetical protein